MRIAICIVTFRRPESLTRLLGSLQELALPEYVDDVSVLVIDNDAGKSARSACDEAREWLRFPLHYTVEKRRGIPQARNTAIGLALGRSDAIAFLDDDAVASRQWLAELLRVQRRSGADAVTGPSRAHFDESPPRWALECGLFDASERDDGVLCSGAYTGNVLLCTAALASMPELFDEEMALCGGSDTEFFQRFSRAGYSIVWAADAVVFECVQASRMTLRWILQRAFRVGAAVTYIQRKQRPGFATAISVLLHALYCGGKGLALLALAVARGRAEAVKALYLAIFGAGRGAGLLGIRSKEYESIHGR